MLLGRSVRSCSCTPCHIVIKCNICSNLKALPFQGKEADWMIERCARRRDGTEDHNRGRLYEERVTILHGLKAALNCDVEGFRVGARRTVANMSDISDDESSPSYRDISRPTSLSDAQLAYNFVRSLQAGTEAHTGFSTNVDMVANALGRGDAWPPEIWT